MTNWLKEFLQHTAGRVNSTAPIQPSPQQPSLDAKARAASAQSFILQPFWPELLCALNEQREAAAARLRDGAETWDQDARNLEHWRATVAITDFVANYPISIIEGGRE